jgi:hypothetical protein
MVNVAPAETEVAGLSPLSDSHPSTLPEKKVMPPPEVPPLIPAAMFIPPPLKSGEPAEMKALPPD